MAAERGPSLSGTALRGRGYLMCHGLCGDGDAVRAVLAGNTHRLRVVLYGDSEGFSMHRYGRFGRPVFGGMRRDKRSSNQAAGGGEA